MKTGTSFRALFALLWLAQNCANAQSLPQLIDGVLSTHPSLRSQRAQAEAAKEGVAAAKWQFYPTPSIGYEQVDPSNHSDPNYPSSGDKSVVTLRVQQPLWTGGRLTAGLDKAQAGESASLSSLEGVRQDLAVRVVQLYADWYGARLKREAFDKSLQAHQLLQAQIVRRIAGGVSPPSDLTLLQGRAQQTEADLTAARAQEQSAILRLNQLIGRTLQAQALTDAMTGPKVLPGQVQDLLDYAQNQSPGILKLLAQARAAEAEVVERKADLMPEAYLRAESQYGSYSFSSAQPQNRLFVGLSTRFGAGLSTLSQVGGAQARYEAAMADVDSSRVSLAEQLQSDFAQAEAGQSRLTALVASLESSANIAKAWNRQFIAGRKTWLDVMNAVRELAQLEAQIADAKSSQLLLSWRLMIAGSGLDAVLAPTTSAVANTSASQNSPLVTDDPDSLLDLPNEPTAYGEADSATLQLRMAAELSPFALNRTVVPVEASQGLSNNNNTAPNKEGTW